MGNWTITLKENDQKILTSSGKTVLLSVYHFIGLLYLKGLFCDNDFYKLGFKTAKKLFDKN